ncbi:hypothetical protein GCM10010411_92150 [Actinomadura fulvescens]|uniref:Uncharacterized protein n=1 Tax=Actinomadura fulvescens TaxID=46160 RepID=A0ABN3QXY5_9ACTN
MAWAFALESIEGKAPVEDGMQEHGAVEDDERHQEGQVQPLAERQVEDQDDGAHHRDEQVVAQAEPQIAPQQHVGAAVHLATAVAPTGTRRDSDGILPSLRRGVHSRRS